MGVERAYSCGAAAVGSSLYAFGGEGCENLEPQRTTRQVEVMHAWRLCVCVCALCVCVCLCV